MAPPPAVSKLTLTGGTGKRMGASMPKQYLQLRGQEIALYSMQTFASMEVSRCSAPHPRRRPIDTAYAILDRRCGAFT